MEMSPMPAYATLRRVAETLLIASAGGLSFNFLGIPAGLISGSVLAVALASLAGRDLTVPLPLARLVMVTVGIALGSVVTPEMLRGIATYPLSIAILAFSTLSMMAANWFYLRAVHRWDGLTALFAASPGALAQVSALSAESDVDLSGVLIVQTSRVVVLTVALPSGLALFGLAGSVARPAAVAAGFPVGELALLVAVSVVPALALHRLRFPGGWLFGAMLGSATLHGFGIVHTGLPGFVSSAAMLTLGAVNGARFSNINGSMFVSYIGAALGSFAVAVAVALLGMAAAASVLQVPPADIVLAYAPGAQDTMMVLALALHLDPVFVGAHHLVRFMIVSLCIPVFARIMARPKARGGG
jgi:uncharacterized protein